MLRNANIWHCHKFLARYFLVIIFLPDKTTYLYTIMAAQANVPAQVTNPNDKLVPFATKMMEKVGSAYKEMWLSFYSCTYRLGMLASLAFPYTLDTGETITEGMGMECLTGDHTPKTDPRHNLVVTAPPYKTRGSSTIGRGGLLALTWLD